MSQLYDRDFHAWTNEQAALLRTGRLHEADIANLAEEIESMGRGERRELVNRLKVLLLHLLKWRFQPNRQGSSWLLTIKLQRLEITKHLLDNPSLKPFLPEAAGDAYAVATLKAAKETGLAESTFPSANPWTEEQLLDPAFWPEAIQIKD